MKGIVLAGGTGSRLLPLTEVTNKHLLPVGRKTMILWPVEKLVRAGVTDILVVSGTEHLGAVVRLLGSGRRYGCSFTYRVQDEAGGIAQALALAEDFCGGDKMVVVLGDNVFQDELDEHIAAYREQPGGGRILLKEVPDAHRFGVAEIQDDQVISIEEKPEQPRSSLAVTGVYLYDPDVFNVIRTLRPSARGELEITDVNRYYLRAGRLTWGLLRGWWTDAGTFESLARANRLVEEATEVESATATVV